jgi:hypothetical protein
MLNKELKVQKAVNAAEQTRRAFWPSLSRADSSLILERPHRFRRGGAKAFADYVYKELSLFGFNSKRNHWEAPATLEAWEQIVDKFTMAGELQVRLSDDVKIWADCAKFAKEMHEEIAADGGEPAHTYKVGAAHYRREASKYRGKLRRLYLNRALECEKNRHQVLSQQKPDEQLSCEEWRERHNRPCGGLDGGCQHCPAEE